MEGCWDQAFEDGDGGRGEGAPAAPLTELFQTGQVVAATITALEADEGGASYRSMQGTLKQRRFLRFA